MTVTFSSEQTTLCRGQRCGEGSTSTWGLLKCSPRAGHSPEPRAVHLGGPSGIRPGRPAQRPSSPDKSLAFWEPCPPLCFTTRLHAPRVLPGAPQRGHTLPPSQRVMWHPIPLCCPLMVSDEGRRLDVPEGTRLCGRSSTTARHASCLAVSGQKSYLGPPGSSHGVDGAGPFRRPFLAPRAAKCPGLCPFLLPASGSRRGPQSHLPSPLPLVRLPQSRASRAALLSRMLMAEHPPGDGSRRGPRATLPTLGSTC